MKGALEVQGRIMLVIFPFYYPNKSQIEIQQYNIGNLIAMGKGRIMFLGFPKS